MLTSINLRITVEHTSGLDDEAIRQRILEEFQETARRGTLLAVAGDHELYTAAVERTFTDAQRLALLDALDTASQYIRDSLRHFDVWSTAERAEMQEDLAVLQNVRDRVEE
jgi:hypothetical protein